MTAMFVKNYWGDEMVSFFKPWKRFEFPVTNIDIYDGYSDSRLDSVSVRFLPMLQFEMTLNWSNMDIKWYHRFENISYNNGYDLAIKIQVSKYYDCIHKIILGRPYRLHEAFFNGVSMYEHLISDERLEGFEEILDLVDDIVLDAYDSLNYQVKTPPIKSGFHKLHGVI